MARLPLEGVRVIDHTEVWGGPYLTTLLADMGAEVIHIEAIQRAPSTRQPLRPAPTAVGYVDNDTQSPRPWERVVNYHAANRNKLGITLDLTRPKGKEIFLRLISLSDVYVANFAAGVLEDMGLTYPIIREANPNIIMISLPGFGEQGPYRRYATLGNSVDALTGHISLRGYHDLGPETVSSITHTDSVAGATGAFAVIAALLYRRRTGKGQFIDMSQAEAFMPHLGSAIMDYVINRRVGRSIGNIDPSMAPHGIYPCQGQERWVAIAVGTDEQWRALCQIMGQPELAEDERYADALSRWHHREELDKLVTEWTRQHSHYEVMNTLQQRGVPAGIVLVDDEDAQNDPHLAARGFFEKVTHPVVGSRSYVSPVWKGSRAPLSIRIPTNTLGQHNEYVYKKVMGLSDEEYEELEREQFIGAEYIEGADVDRQDRERIVR